MRRLWWTVTFVTVTTVVLLATTASDDFNRADNASLGGNWTMYSYGTFAVVSNKATACAACGVQSHLAGWSASSFGSDQFSQATISGSGTLDYIGVGIHISGSGGAENSYQFYCSPTTSTWPSSFVAKQVAGTGTTLSSDLGSCASGDVLKIQNVGSTITAYRNGGAAIFTGTDSSVTGGTAGMTIYVASLGSQHSQLDDWSGGDVGGGGATFPIAILNVPFRCCR